MHYLKNLTRIHQFRQLFQFKLHILAELPRRKHQLLLIMTTKKDFYFIGVMTVLVYFHSLYCLLTAFTDPGNWVNPFQLYLLVAYYPKSFTSELELFLSFPSCEAKQLAEALTEDPPPYLRKSLTFTEDVQFCFILCCTIRGLHPPDVESAMVLPHSVLRSDPLCFLSLFRQLQIFICPLRRVFFAHKDFVLSTAFSLLSRINYHFFLPQQEKYFELYVGYSYHITLYFTLTWNPEQLDRS